MRKRWEQAEKYVANNTKGYVVRGSGRGNIKGDVETMYYLYQVKTTKQNTFSITESLLEKVINDSIPRMKIPRLVVGLGDPIEYMWFGRMYDIKEESHEVIPVEGTICSVRREDIVNNRVVKFTVPGLGTWWGMTLAMLKRLDICLT